MKTIYVHGSNHFDPIWRRGFEKPFYHKGEKFVGNGVIQEACISEWVAMSEHPALKFEVECSFVLRHYLRKHPEHLETLRRMVQEGRFELLAAGEIIPDPHMPIGETLVRNLTYGLWWAEDTLGVLPTTGCANDGFGTSAQMPQLFRGVGVEWLTGLSYGFPTKDYWRGLDGTTIYINQDFRTKNTKYLGRTSYYRPCPSCGGEGCDDCLGRGFDHSYRMDGSLDASKLDMERYPFGWIEAGGEENLVPLDLAERVERLNESSGSAGGYRYEFALIKDLAALYGDDLARVDSPDPGRLSPEVEGRPVSSGCWVSRIKTKQEVRRLESRIESLEKRAALAHLNGVPYPGEALAEGWRGIAFAAFHDSITGTHVDVGYEELLELYADVDSQLDKAEAALRLVGADPLAADREIAIPAVSADPDSADEEFVSVFNSNSYEVTGEAKVELPGVANALRLIDENGDAAAIYGIEIGEEGTTVRFRAERMQGLTWRTYRVERLVELRETGTQEGQRSSDGASGTVKAGVQRSDDKGIGVVAAHAWQTETATGGIAMVDAGDRTIENEFYRVVADTHGLVSIFDKRLGRELVDATKGYAGELVLEHDVGDPWTTRELNRPRLRLGSGTRLVGVEKSAHESVITFRGKMPGNDNVTDPLDYRVMVLEWEQRVIVKDGIPRVDFETWIDWDTFDRRIRVSFPTNVVVRNDPGHYAIPYGTLTRNRYEMGYTGWENANGDWPAVEWASTAAASGLNVALFNKGTPSCRIERGEILLSILRSPTFPNCLLWPKEYNAPVYDGMRDQGEHLFSYSLYSYEGEWRNSDVVREAYAYNKPLVAMAGKVRANERQLALQAKHTLVSALKKEERGNGTIVRLFEYGGSTEEAALSVPTNVRRAYRTDLLERNEQELAVAEDGTVKVALEPFQIMTIKLLEE